MVFTRGYQRAEVAIVPTNRSANEEPGEHRNGAADTTDVLMELRYNGIFSTGEGSGIYQRLAVGTTAVKQPGASAMFARDHDGNVDAAVLQNLRVIDGD